MSYNPNIPQVTDPILQSYSQLRANFQAIDSTFADNHIGLTRNTMITGMHSDLTYNPQTLDPATTAIQTALYTKLVAGIPALFYRPNNSQTPIQLTFDSIRTGLQSTNPDVYFPTQYSFMAGPFIVHIGRLTMPANGFVVNLIPGTTLLFVDLVFVNLKVNKKGTALISPTLIAGNSFTVSIIFSGVGSPAPTYDVFYFAIGV